MGWVYRLRQGMARIAARWRPPDVSPAAELLDPAAMALFTSMSSADQGHALAVLHRLRSEGDCSPDLEVAALLHDTGKTSGGLTLPYRTAIVLLERFWPEMLRRLCDQAEGTWREPFAVDALHPAIGAERCERAGCSQRTVALVCQHDTTCDAVAVDLRNEVIRLRRADDQS